MSLPGVGKTTLIQKASEVLQSSGVPVDGFYTQEVRQGGRRIGFDVVTLSGARGPLSRAGYWCSVSSCLLSLACTVHTLSEGSSSLCECACVWSMYLCRGQGSTLVSCSATLCFSPSRQGLSLNLELACGPANPRSLLPLPLQDWAYKHDGHVQRFPSVLRI